MLDTTIGPYRIVRKISQGGMGIVYEAIHEAIERRVAIKVLHSDLSRSQEVLTRFFNEARAVNRIDHPGIVQCHDFGQLADGTAFIVMEFLKGETLSRRARRMNNAIPLPDIVRLLRQVAAALGAAHAKGIVHRDLKPDNVMIIADPEISGGERTKVLDFGIAKLREPNGAGAKAVTKGDLLLGTPAYMSPEQCKGAGNVDAKTDCYSLGVMLYRLISGRLPLRAEGSGELMALHIFQEPEPLGGLCPWVPESLTQLVHRLLAKDKGARPDMAEVANHLDRIAPECANVVRPESLATGKDAVVNLEVDPGTSSENASMAETIDSDVIPVVPMSGRSLPTPITPTPITPSSRTGPSVRLASDGSLSTGRPSTLGMSAAESAGTGPQGGGARRWLPLLLAGGLGAAALGGFLMLRSGRPGGGVSGLAPAVQPAADRRVQWEIRSSPTGAEVRRVSDGALLGHTPWQSERLAAEGGEEVRITAPGHAERLVVLSRSQNESREVVLQAAARPEAATAPTAQPEDSAGSGGKRGRGRSRSSKPAEESAEKKGGKLGVEIED